MGLPYVRFRNTLRNLTDCYDKMNAVEGLSDNEFMARRQLINLCVDIAVEYGDEIDRYVQEEDKP